MGSTPFSASRVIGYTECMKTHFKFVKTITLLLVALTAANQGCNSEGGTTVASYKQWPTPPAMQIDVDKTYKAVFDTSLGSFEIELLPKESPLTVNNFVFLAREGYYDSTVFHRIVKSFVIQGGDPTATGGGDPGYSFADELPPKHSYDTGIVAMANSGANTNGSQFFICTGYQAQNLNNYPNYTQFGRVSSGMDVVQKIAAVPVGLNAAGNEMSRPLNPPKINKVTIIES
jgi:cyclophilin family peptidyl-prolyl cis-trans isomerase